MNEKHDKNYVRHEDLRRQASIQFVLNGLKRFLRSWASIPFVGINVILILLISSIPDGVDVFGNITRFLYRGASMIFLIVGDCIILAWYGMPKGFVHIMRRIERVPFFRNGDLEPPLLIERVVIDKENKIEKWVFRSCGIGYGEWQETKLREQIENAVDIAILDVGYGDDNTLAVLKLLYHPGPWPETIPWDDKFLPEKESQICLGLNRAYPVVIDLALRPHYFIAGETGCGKSVLIRAIINQSLKKKYVVYLIDFKHFVDYVSLLPGIEKAVDEEDDLAVVLNEAVMEMHRRLTLLRYEQCANITDYNNLHPETPMPRMLIVIDEYTEAIAKTGDKERKAQGERNEVCVEILSKLARAAGISLIIGLQRGGQDISGQIRSNTRVILGRCNDNLSIVMTGSTELGRVLPTDGVGMFVTDDRQIFKSFLV